MPWQGAAITAEHSRKQKERANAGQNTDEQSIESDLVAGEEARVRSAEGETGATHAHVLQQTQVPDLRVHSTDTIEE